MVLLASDYDKSKYLKATDLDREKKFRIKTVTEEESSSKGRKRRRSSSSGSPTMSAGLVLNKTNNRTFAALLATTLPSWAGKIIAMFPTMADIPRQDGPALRVRIPPPKQAAAAAAPPHSRRRQATAAAACRIDAAAAPARRHRCEIRSLSLIR